MAALKFEVASWSLHVETGQCYMTPKSSYHLQTCSFNTIEAEFHFVASSFWTSTIYLFRLLFIDIRYYIFTSLTPIENLSTGIFLLLLINAERIQMFWGNDRGKWETCSCWESNPGHLVCAASKYSATELRWPDNHQPSQCSMCTAQVVLKCPRLTPSSHSVCAIRLPVLKHLNSLYSSMKQE